MTDKPEKVLIVDDEEGIRRLLHQKLSGEGYQCQEASNAEQALEKLKSGPVALVLLDIMMPGKKGSELLPEIKASYPDTAVVMATATTDTSIAIQCMKQGAYDYISKPFDLNEVALGIERALEKRRLELENRDYQQQLERKVEEQARKIRASFFNAMIALVHALEAKDSYTSGHSQRVSEVSVAVAEALGMPPESVQKIRLAGLIHDIGKIGVREFVLNRPGRVTDEEFLHIKSHTGVGMRILIPIVEDKEILEMVEHHHERYDGTGYPDGLSGEQIPFGARILMVTDSYDAMTSERPYRQAMDIEKACAEIEDGKGSQFDPKVADAFLKIREFIYSIITRRGGNVERLF